MSRKRCLVSPVMSRSSWARLMLAVPLFAAAGGCEPQAPPGQDLVQGRMAVLPLVNETGNPAMDEIGVALENAAAAAAAELDGADLILVRQSNEVSAEDSPSEIASRTGASLIVRGTITAAGDEVVLKAEIVDPSDGSVMHDLPSERGPAADAEGAARRLASRIAGGLALHLDRDWLSPRLYFVPTIEAYRLSKLADSAFARMEYEEAVRFSRQAYQQDTVWVNVLSSAWGAAYNAFGRTAPLTDSLYRFVSVRRDMLTPVERIWLDWNKAWQDLDPAAEWEAAQAASEIDSLGALYALGVTGNRTGHWQEAAEALSHRGELAAMGNYSAQTWPAWRAQFMTALHALGDHETELAEARAANEAYPDNPWWIWNEMMALAGLGRADQVLLLVDSAKVLLQTSEDPSFYESLEDIAVELKVHGHPEAGAPLLEEVIAHYREIENPYQLADALGFAGRTQEAFETLQPTISDQSTPDQIGWFGAAAAIVGETEVAEEMLSTLESRPDAATGNNLRYQAAIQGALGQCDRAVELYREAHSAGFVYNQAWNGEWWHRDWETVPVRENCPGFQTLLNKTPG